MADEEITTRLQTATKTLEKVHTEFQSIKTNAVSNEADATKEKNRWSTFGNILGLEEYEVDELKEYVSNNQKDALVQILKKVAG